MLFSQNAEGYLKVVRQRNTAASNTKIATIDAEFSGKQVSFTRPVYPEWKLQSFRYAFDGQVAGKKICSGIISWLNLSTNYSYDRKFLHIKIL